MKEVTAPVIATTLVMVAIFIPVAVHGRHHRPAVSAVCHHRGRLGGLFLLNALTLSPALCSLLLRKQKPMRGPLGCLLRHCSTGVRQDHRQPTPALPAS
jgi:HAE1 family hydrophobic/amphiphilic exporter-1